MQFLSENMHFSKQNRIEYAVFVEIPATFENEMKTHSANGIIFAGIRSSQNKQEIEVFIMKLTNTFKKRSLMSVIGLAMIFTAVSSMLKTI